MIGELLDNRYQVLKLIGGGGMGEVYLVENTESGRKEALKILHSHVLNQDQFVSRFRREARAMNRLSHPNIVTVYDFGQLPDSRFYLAMEHANGEDLGALLDRQDRLPVSRSTRVLSQLADAIDHAHARGVIHRDLKPDNMILVQRYGETDLLKVMDFGIAKIIASDYEETSPTSHGLRCGTPPYMAPEQFGDQADDPRIDIYALGCIGYELLTGKPPFDGTAIELFQQHLSKTPRRPSHVAPRAGISAELDEIILCCLEKRPEDRYQSGADVASAIHRIPGVRRRRGKHRTPAPRELDTIPESGDEVDTSQTEVDDPREHARDPAMESDLESNRTYYRVVLQQLADTLLDLGCTDAAIVVAVAEMRALLSDLMRCTAEEDQLQQQRMDVEESAREREALLRFATSELRFERKRGANDGGAGEIDAQLVGLRRRLAEVARDTEDALAAITEREISLAAVRAEKEEALERASGVLDDAIKAITPRYLDDGLVAELTSRLRDARAGVRAASRVAG